MFAFAMWRSHKFVWTERVGKLFIIIPKYTALVWKNSHYIIKTNTFESTCAVVHFWVPLTFSSLSKMNWMKALYSSVWCLHEIAKVRLSPLLHGQFARVALLLLVGGLNPGWIWVVVQNCHVAKVRVTRTQSAALVPTGLARSFRLCS